MMKTELYKKLEVYDFKSLFEKKKYAYFLRGDYNLNIIGVRKYVEGNKVTNLYDDYLVVIYNVEGKEHRDIYNITTEPGLSYMGDVMFNPKGTAILKPAQYRSSWVLGKHRGKYTALCQSKPVTVYRDNDKDKIYDLDPKKTTTGVYGINIHRSNEYYTRKTVDQYSGGCQVFNDPKQFAQFIKVCKKQEALYGNSFTYTLLDEKDLI